MAIRMGTNASDSAASLAREQRACATPTRTASESAFQTQPNAGGNATFVRELFRRMFLSTPDDAAHGSGKKAVRAERAERTEIYQ